ncbi:MAG: DUF4932 domain-containing protein [Defluviitaleaceae bacterium]|nr:DUF4932 domain-containing protein [Defluviitaleaceae bacterium]
MAKHNFVDERFELISVIFRLAGNWEYNIGAGGLDGIRYPLTDEQYVEHSKCEHTNGYQLEVVEVFEKYAQHEAVQFAKRSGLNFSDPFRFAMHIEKDEGKFVFIENIESLFYSAWNRELAEEFLPLLNKFYKDTSYSEFYISHIPYFEGISQIFYDDFYHTVDFDWYSKYVDVANLRCVLSPSNTACNYATTVNDKIVCGMVRMSAASVLIHEFNHSFANPLAERWYAENETFKKWCDDSVDIEKMPYYNSGLEMAREYVTHAYEVLYALHHGKEWEKYLLGIKNAGFENAFPYINEVYELVLSLEK